MNQRVGVIGAGGHTGSFVVAELRRWGITPIPCGRATDLDLALRDADAVINCAGPFAATAAPVIESAIRFGIAYLDVTAELEVVTDTFASYAEAGIPIVPAAGFYGGLADLLTTAAMGAGRWPIISPSRTPSAVGDPPLAPGIAHRHPAGRRRVHDGRQRHHPDASGHARDLHVHVEQRRRRPARP